jgi:uncharacterized membrane protein
MPPLAAGPGPLGTCSLLPAPAALAVLPSGFEVPPLPHLLVLLVGLALAGGALYRRRPRVTSRVVAAFAPWMVVGATLYALTQARAVLGSLRPLFAAPSVYATTFVVAGLVWAATTDTPADRWGLPSSPGVLGVTGSALAGALIAYGVVVALGRGTLSLFWPTVGLIVSVVVAGGLWLAIRDRAAVAVTGAPGVLVVFGHALDGISTAIGTHLGYGEQTPLSRLVIEFAAALPTAPYLGAGWLFVLLKLALATAVVWVLADYVREEPEEGLLMLGFVAAVGLGPGAHNLVLFAIS